MKDKVLVVEDEQTIAETILFAFESNGFEAKWVSLGGEGLKLLKAEDFDLVILDVGLPDILGFELCKSIRQFSAIPIIFLTARKEEIDRVVGLEIGADDYVLKPFSPRELVARAKAVLRRTQKSSKVVNDNNNDGEAFEIHDLKKRVSYKGQFLELSKYEYGILCTFLSQTQRVFSRDQLMDAVWDDPAASFDRTVDSHIKSLRQKLKTIEPQKDFIKTHRGLGYSFEI